MSACWSGRDLVVPHLPWGGGTPTILRGSDWRRISRGLEGCFNLAFDAEIAVEIDPRTLTLAV
jgi:oxygen-independent coproporphyrinogen-3 oxidase